MGQSEVTDASPIYLASTSDVPRVSFTNTVADLDVTRGAIIGGSFGWSVSGWRAASVTLATGDGSSCSSSLEWSTWPGSPA